MRKPNFLIVGAAKAGTTSAAKYLNKHPDIFIPEQKELRFFARKALSKVNPKDPSIEGIYRSSTLNEDEYFAQFNVKSKFRGEASVHYLYHHKEVIPEVKQQLGDIPIIIFLRNPVTRAISHIKYLHTEHQSSYEREIEMESKRRADGYNSFWYYLSLGLYSDQVEAYLKEFSKVKIVLFENFIQNPKQELDQIFDFLEAKPYISDEFKVYNKALEQRTIFKFLKRSGAIDVFQQIIGKNISDKIQKNFKKKILKEIKLKPKPETIDFLNCYYEKEIDKIESIINMDLSYWKTKNDYQAK